MKFYNNNLSRIALAVGALTALLTTAQGAIAGQYFSEVEFPYIYSSGETHRVNLPFSLDAPDGVKVKSVSWSWTPSRQGYNVKLCQMATNICKDVSLQNSGSSSGFGRGDAALPFYFLVTSRGRPFNPEWGLKGSLTVNW
ncbi:hypothetical protein [Pseudomonas sp. DSP3-2-2]|uniref:hypothetical protein n=1 Tax=unclassified Pseudomonas TaxID=196821 RepID=UPI003CF357DC